MDGQGAQAAAAQPQQQQQQLPPHQQPSLIRTDQVAKLPHLNEQQKTSQTHYIRGLWEVLNSRDPSSDEYRSAQMKLMQVSQTLMKGMQMYKQRLHQQQQAQAAAQTQRPQAASNPTTFGQLLPAIQAKVNSIQFHLPPNVNREQAASWLNEAKLRYGMALQKQEMGRQRSLEVRQQVQARQSAGTMAQEEMQEFRNRQAQAEKLYREGGDFLKKFQEQQEQFKAARAGGQGAASAQQQQQQQQGATSQTAVAPAGVSTNNTTTNNNNTTTTTTATTTAANNNTPSAAQMHTGQAQAPAPHTINSAVNAARVQAGQVQNMSPSTQIGQGQGQAQPQAQTPTTQAAAPGSQASFTQAGQQQAQVQAQAQVPGQQPDGTAAQGQPVNPPGPPRPLSHEAAISQAAKSYQGNKLQQQQQGTPQAATNPNANPPGYIQNRSAENTTRNINMAIPKNLNISQPEPVPMGTPRPTLSGGPSHGGIGVMGQPAIQKHPGYVLEGEGQRVLSKKMLDILVRQVTGGGEGEGLTPDAEEFILQMADDFVDDVITAACRLAKLRPSSTLEIRDIQLVLERNYNMRISGFSTDDLRTVKKPQPAQGWTQKMSAVQAAKVTQGKTE